MRAYPDCIPCFVRQTLDAIRMATNDPAVHEVVMRETLGILAAMDTSPPPPVTAQAIHHAIQRVTGVADTYYAAKRQFNAFALRLYPDLTRRVDEFHDPISAAVHLAAAGNIVDIGVRTDLDESHIHEAIETALHDPLDAALLDEFKSAVHAARDILYLGDNSGEIVFDRILIERLFRHGLARDNITFVVRGRPILNDVLMEDAIETGIADLVPVIDNGSDVPGTWLPDCSASFRERFDRADLVISKGQGSYETLNDVDKPIFFLLKAKCAVVSAFLGCPMGTLILKKN